MTVDKIENVQIHLEAIADAKAVAILRALSGIIADNQQRLNTLVTLVNNIQAEIAALPTGGSGGTTEPDCCIQLADSVASLTDQVTVLSTNYSAMEDQYNDLSVRVQQLEAQMQGMGDFIANTILPALNLNPPS